MTYREAREKILAMTPEELQAWKTRKGYEVCPRCGGTGTYSYNAIYGNTCFKCHGLGYAPISHKEKKARIYSQGSDSRVSKN